MQLAIAGEAMQIDPSVPGFTAMNVALVVLQALHVRASFIRLWRNKPQPGSASRVLCPGADILSYRFAPIPSIAAASSRGSV